jgi:hypothetical protein
MRIARTLLLGMLSCGGLGACATAPTPVPPPTPQSAPEPALQVARTWHRFEARPPKPADCDFEVFEEREPPRRYRQIGVLPFTTNAWMSAAARKRALRETVCEAGADAVLLPHPAVRRMSIGTGQDEEVREYAARFVIWTDGTAAEAAESPAPGQPHEPGVLVVPVGPEWPEETEGTSTRQAPAPQR